MVMQCFYALTKQYFYTYKTETGFGFMAESATVNMIKPNEIFSSTSNQLSDVINAHYSA